MNKKILIILLCAVFILSFSACQQEAFSVKTLSDVEIELVKTEIVEWQGFNPDEMVWRETEKLDDIDAYIFSCIVCEEEYIEYSFIVSVKYYNGEIDIDAWQLYR
jgi:hypothetical protein